MSLYSLNGFRASHCEGQLEQIQIKVGKNEEGFFKLLAGRLCKPVVLITSEDTVETLKKIIEVTTGIAFGKQHISHKGSELENKMKLVEALDGEKAVHLTCDALAQECFSMEDPKVATNTKAFGNSWIEEDYAELLPECGQGLINIVKYESFQSDLRKFFCKAFPLYIIKGMESENSGMAALAVKTMETVAEFYMNERKSDKHVDDLQKAVFAMAKSYFDQADSKKAAYDLIKEMVQGDSDILAILKNEPYFVIDGGEAG